MGDTTNYEHRGVAPRALSQLFGEINARVECEYRVSCTYLELYGDKIFDLLTDLSNTNQAGEFTIAEEKDGRGVFVRGLNEIPVTNENEALNLLFSGELARTTAQHKLNRRSNRSHSIFTIYIQQRQKSGINERVTHSKLHLVDLAGSERLKKTMDSSDGSTADEVTRKESMTINQSLTYLEQCVVALARKSPHIPYRQSKLTVILKDALGANCNTLMIACMWGEADHLEETISTLRLASRMMRVQNETSTVQTIDDSALIKKQAKLIKALKQELLMHDALVERAGVGYEPYTPEQQSGIRQMLEVYIDSNEVEEEDNLNIDSFRKMLEVCKQFKKMVLSAREEARTANENAFSNYAGSRAPTSGSEFMGTASDFQEKTNEMFEEGNANYVGEDDPADYGKTGFGMGLAASNSSPTSMPSSMTKPSGGLDAKSGAPESSGQSGDGQKRASVEFADDSKEGDSSIRDNSYKRSTSMGATSDPKSRTLDAFSRNEGSGVYEALTSAKQTLKELKAKNRECSQQVNAAKREIDSLQNQLAQHKQERIRIMKESGYKAEDTEDIIDEEEFILMKDLKEAKRSYKNAFEQLNKLKQNLERAQYAAESSRDAFASQFAMWNTGMGQSQGKFDDTTNSYDFKDTDPEVKGGGSFDQLDDQEAFERLEVDRVMSKDPDSLAFFHAQKTRRAHMTQNGSNIKQIHKSKRLG
jgi:kinesin family protein 6/9